MTAQGRILNEVSAGEEGIVVLGSMKNMKKVTRTKMLVEVRVGTRVTFESTAGKAVPVRICHVKF